MEPEPTRWKDDPEVEAAIRDDLARVAEVPAPAIDVNAGLTRLEAAIRSDGGGSGAGGLGAVGPWIAGAILAIAAAGALAWALSDDEPPPERAAVAPSPRPAIVVAPSAAPPREAPAEAEPEIVEASEAPPPRRRPRARATPAPEAVAPAHAPYTLQEEMEHLARTQSALGRDPARALALAEEGQRRFPPPQAVYREEREGIAILALVELGRRDEARSRSQRFLALHPRGPFSDRVRRALAAP